MVDEADYLLVIPISHGALYLVEQHSVNIKVFCLSCVCASVLKWINRGPDPDVHLLLLGKVLHA